MTVKTIELIIPERSPFEESFKEGMLQFSSEWLGRFEIVIEARSTVSDVQLFRLICAHNFKRPDEEIRQIVKEFSDAEVEKIIELVVKFRLEHLMTYLDALRPESPLSVSEQGSSSSDSDAE